MKQLLKKRTVPQKTPDPFSPSASDPRPARSLCRIDMALERLQSTSV